jgi:hypothetical protein
MTTENNSSPEENQEASESVQISSDMASAVKQCTHDGDCPSGQSCVGGECVSGSPEAS